MREARESRGLALDDAARATRIGRNYLLALEDEAFGKLPSPAYVKGFLRAYANYLGLSSDDVVRCYEAALQPTISPEEGRGASVTPPVQSPRIPVRNRWAIPFSLLFLVIALSYLTREREEQPLRREPPSSTKRVLAPSPPVQPVISTASRVRTAPHLQPDGAAVAVTGDERPSGTSTDGIVLKLKVNQDCLLNITIDGTLSQQYELKAGDLIEWKGERVFSLDLNDGGGVEAEFNGKTLPPFGASGSPVHVDLSADGSDE